MSKQDQALQNVLHYLCELHHQGKPASVAAVKNIMPIAPPLPIITRAVSAFKQEPERYYQSWLKHEKEVSAPPTQKNITTEAPPESLEQRLEKLEQRIKILENIIQQQQVDQ